MSVQTNVPVVPHVRARLQIVTQNEAVEFINALCDGKTTDHFDLENFASTQRVNTRSILGVLYATAEFKDEIYLVNLDNDGVFPAAIDKFRA